MEIGGTGLISDPLGSVTMSYSDVAIVGDIAYAARFSSGPDGGSPVGAGLAIIDLSDLTAPVEVGILETPGGVEDIAVSGNRAYLAEGAAGLQVLDITDPRDPLPVGRVSFDGLARSVSVSAGFAYVAASSGLMIVDVADAGHPRWIGANRGFNAHDVAVGPYSVYVAAGDDGLILFDKPLRIGPASVQPDGRLRILLHGPGGRDLRIQRSLNMIDWEDWRSVTLDGDGSGIVEDPTINTECFYRVVAEALR